MECDVVSTLTAMCGRRIGISPQLLYAVVNVKSFVLDFVLLSFYNYVILYDPAQSLLSDSRITGSRSIDREDTELARCSGCPHQMTFTSDF